MDRLAAIAVIQADLLHSHREPADQVGGLLVPMGLGQGGEAREVGNRNVCSAGSDRCTIAHPNLRPDNQARGARLLLVRASSAAGHRGPTCAVLARPDLGYGARHQIIKLAWVGTRTDNAAPTLAFFRDVLGLRLELDQPGFWMLKLPDGSKVEVFGSDSEINRHFTTSPVAGFLVDDVQAATAELRSAGVEILFESGVDESGNAWVHFRAPDGNLYEFTQDSGVSRPR